MVYENRIKVIYVYDEYLVIRKFYENFDIKKLYDEYLVELLGEKFYYLLYIIYCIGKEVVKWWIILL